MTAAPPPAPPRAAAARVARFSGVAAAGFVVQLVALSLLIAAGVHYLVATVVAVEAAILHNYLWHERWTFGDRRASAPPRARRLLRFNGVTALVSIGGNVGLMLLLAGHAGIPPAVANAIAVAVLGLVNFVAADRLVFRAPGPSARRRGARGALTGGRSERQQSW